MTAVIGALIVAALTGVSIIAYRHPDGYPKLAITVTVVLAIILVILLAYDIGVVRTDKALWLHIEDGWEAKAKEAVASLRVPTWIIWSLPLVSLYVGLLFLLPHITGFQDKPHNRTPRKRQ